MNLLTQLATTSSAVAVPDGIAARFRSDKEAKASATVRTGIQGDKCPAGCIKSSGRAGSKTDVAKHALQPHRHPS